MEGVPKPESQKKDTSYIEAGTTFMNQLRVFESMHSNESFKTIPDAIYGFASFIRAQSEKVLDAVRDSQTGLPEKQKEEYRLEQAAAKLHEFNLANATILHLYAEVLGESVESSELYRSMFPWLRGIDVWATQYVRENGADK
jgi:hypothetical protein